MSSMNPKVCAVIVTYNKPDYLRRCLEKFLEQEVLPNELLIWDNASDIETNEICQNFMEKCDEMSLLNSRGMSISYYRSAQNTGGAGGFHGGVDFALRNDFDFVWLMDDDGYPEKMALKRLLAVSDNQTVLNPLVVCDKDNETLSFFRRKGELYKKDEINTPFINDKIAPFNGTLIPLDIIKSIGNIDSKYFIWGDEMEFSLRLRKNNIRVKTVVDSIHFHPINKKLPLRNLGVFGEIRQITNPYFEYIYYRNRFNYTIKYTRMKSGIFVLLKLLLETLINIIHALLTRRHSVHLICEGIYHGVTNNFSITYDKFIHTRTP